MLNMRWFQVALGEEPLVFFLSMFWIRCCLLPALSEVVVVAAEVLFLFCMLSTIAIQKIPQYSPEALWPRSYSPAALTTTVCSDCFQACCFLMPTVQFNWSSLGPLISQMQGKIETHSNCTQNWTGNLCLSGKARKLIKRQTNYNEINKRKQSLFLDVMNL